MTVDLIKMADALDACVAEARTPDPVAGHPGFVHNVPAQVLSLASAVALISQALRAAAVSADPGIPMYRFPDGTPDVLGD